MTGRRVAVFGGAGAPYHYLGLLARAGHRAVVVFAEDIEEGQLASCDAFVMPGGSYGGVLGQMSALGPSGALKVGQFVADGGLYIGSCSGAYIGATADEDAAALGASATSLCLSPARMWQAPETERPAGIKSLGVGRVVVEAADPSHPIVRGLSGPFETMYYNGPLFVGGEPLLRVVGTTDRFTPSEGFFDRSPTRPTLMADAIAEGASAAVTGRHGDGHAVLFGSHPEFGFSLPLLDWRPPSVMVLNALEWHAKQSSRKPPPTDEMSRTRPLRKDAGGRQLDACIASALGAASVLRSRALDRAWIQQEYAMSIMGRSPKRVWLASLDWMVRLLREIQTHGSDISSEVTDPLEAEGTGRDFGYLSVATLLAQAGQLLTRAINRWDWVPLGAPSDPYAFGRTGESPYYLVAGSYLSALGRVAAAALLCRWGERNIEVPARAVTFRERETATWIESR